ncbi:hypothetical protein XS17_03450 [Salmonella enterica subsp. enterica]|nr:hypothetical protein [Salmonella enterica subsp. enterica]
MDLNQVIWPLFAKVNRFEPPEGATLRLMWHWHVITRKRSSQITGTLAVVGTTTISLFIIHSDATDVNAAASKKSSVHKNKKSGTIRHRLLRSAPST